MNNLTNVWNEVSGWPADQRLELAKNILNSLQPTGGDILRERQDALRALIGIWKSNQPPTDQDVLDIIGQERMKKYA